MNCSFGEPISPLGRKTSMKAISWIHGVLVSAIIFFSYSSLSLAAIPLSAWPENPYSGSVVFAEKLCFKCHDILGKGGKKGPDLGQLQFSGGFLNMAGIMWNHAPKMIDALSQEKIPYPKFNNYEMTRIITFLFSLNYLDPPGDARQGEKAFASKRCNDCHQVGWNGGKIGPPLDKYGSLPPVYIATALWNKGPAIVKTMEREKIPRPPLSGDDIRNIVAFIKARGKLWPSTASNIFQPAGNPRNGASLFESKGCSWCHPLYAGEGGEGPPLATRNLKVSFSNIASRMWNHAPKMWALWKEKKSPPITLNVEEMTDLTSYLYFLQFKSPYGDSKRGATIFTNRGCGGCHKTAGKGESIAPDLRTKGPWESDVDLAREMWNHAGKMIGSLKTSASKWPKLSEQEVADLFAYIRNIGGTKKNQQ